MTHISKDRGSGLRKTSVPGYKLHENTLTGEFSFHPLSRTDGQTEKATEASAGHLAGMGSLHSSTGEAGAVRYHLPVRQAHGTQVGEGFIWGDADLLHQIYMDSEHTLHIGDGRIIPILMTSLDSNRAEFRTTGPIPGFETSFAKAREGVMV